MATETFGSADAKMTNGLDIMASLTDLIIASGGKNTRATNHGDGSQDIISTCVAYELDSRPYLENDDGQSDRRKRPGDGKDFRTFRAVAIGRYSGSQIHCNGKYTGSRNLAPSGNCRNIKDHADATGLHVWSSTDRTASGHNMEGRLKALFCYDVDAATAVIHAPSRYGKAVP
ncbi:MAG: hypothetical protein Q9214_001612 [Letrouitia sp. 1 TL-2023]